MERRGLEARPHGFRSKLRVWLTENQQASREVAETIIAHQTGSLTERAYNRTDFLEQRRKLMEAWEWHLADRIPLSQIKQIKDSACLDLF